MFGSKRRAEERAIAMMREREIYDSYRDSLPKAIKEVLKSKHDITLRVSYGYDVKIRGSKNFCQIYFDIDTARTRFDTVFMGLQEKFGETHSFTFSVYARIASGATLMRGLACDFGHSYRDEYSLMPKSITFDSLESMHAWVNTNWHNMQDAQYQIVIKKIEP